MPDTFESLMPGVPVQPASHQHQQQRRGSNSLTPIATISSAPSAAAPSSSSSSFPHQPITAASPMLHMSESKQALSQPKPIKSRMSMPAILANVPTTPTNQQREHQREHYQRHQHQPSSSSSNTNDPSILPPSPSHKSSKRLTSLPASSRRKTTSHLSESMNPLSIQLMPLSIPSVSIPTTLATVNSPMPMQNERKSLILAQLNLGLGVAARRETSGDANAVDNTSRPPAASSNTVSDATPAAASSPSLSPPPQFTPIPGLLSPSPPIASALGTGVVGGSSTPSTPEPPSSISPPVQQAHQHATPSLATTTATSTPPQQTKTIVPAIVTPAASTSSPSKTKPRQLLKVTTASPALTQASISSALAAASASASLAASNAISATAASRYPFPVFKPDGDLDMRYINQQHVLRKRKVTQYLKIYAAGYILLEIPYLLMDEWRIADNYIPILLRLFTSLLILFSTWLNTRLYIARYITHTQERFDLGICVLLMIALVNVSISEVYRSKDVIENDLLLQHGYPCAFLLTYAFIGGLTKIRWNMMVLFAVAGVAIMTITILTTGIRSTHELLLLLGFYCFALFSLSLKLHQIDSRRHMTLNQQKSQFLERKKAEKLLRSMLPTRILSDYLDGNIGQLQANATIGFVQIHLGALPEHHGPPGSHQSTSPQAIASPGELMQKLHDTFKRIDGIVNMYALRGIQKIETVATTYLLCAGLLQEIDDHAAAMIDVSLEIMSMVNTRLNIGAQQKRIPVMMRIGISSGPVVGGIIGAQRRFFRVFGDTVNVAARMCTNVRMGCIQLSPSCYAALNERQRGAYKIPPGTKLDIKGKGEMMCYRVESRADWVPRFSKISMSRGQQDRDEPLLNKSFVYHKLLARTEIGWYDLLFKQEHGTGVSLEKQATFVRMKNASIVVNGTSGQTNAGCATGVNNTLPNSPEKGVASSRNLIIVNANATSPSNAAACGGGTQNGGTGPAGTGTAHTSPLASRRFVRAAQHNQQRSVMSSLSHGRHGSITAGGSAGGTAGEEKLVSGANGSTSPAAGERDLQRASSQSHMRLRNMTNTDAQTLTACSSTKSIMQRGDGQPQHQVIDTSPFGTLQIEHYFQTSYSYAFLWSIRLDALLYIVFILAVLIYILTYHSYEECKREVILLCVLMSQFLLFYIASMTSRMMNAMKRWNRRRMKQRKSSSSASVADEGDQLPPTGLEGNVNPLTLQGSANTPACSEQRTLHPQRSVISRFGIGSTTSATSMTLTKTQQQQQQQQNSAATDILAATLNRSEKKNKSASSPASVHVCDEDGECCLDDEEDTDSSDTSSTTSSLTSLFLNSSHQLDSTCHFSVHLQKYNLFFCIALYIWILLIMNYEDLERREQPSYIDPLYTFFLLGYFSTFLLRLQFRHVVLMAILTVVTLTVLVSVNYSYQHSLLILLNLFLAATIGLLVSYQHEQSERSNFLIGYAMEKEQEYMDQFLNNLLPKDVVVLLKKNSQQQQNGAMNKGAALNTFHHPAQAQQQQQQQQLLQQSAQQASQLQQGQSSSQLPQSSPSLYTQSSLPYQQSHPPHHQHPQSSHKHMPSSSLMMNGSQSKLMRDLAQQQRAHGGTQRSMTGGQQSGNVAASPTSHQHNGVGSAGGAAGGHHHTHSSMAFMQNGSNGGGGTQRIPSINGGNGSNGGDVALIGITGDRASMNMSPTPLTQQQQLQLQQQQQQQRSGRSGSVSVAPPSMPTMNLGEGRVASRFAMHFPRTTVFESDIVGYTAMVSQLTPSETLNLLNMIFSRFDQVAQDCAVEKIETIGDAFMCMVFDGPPDPVLDFSLLIVDVLQQCNLETKPKQELQIRMGICTGSCFGGIVGTEIPRFHLFGQAHDVAIHIEQNGRPGDIIVSSSTYALSQDRFDYDALDLVVDEYKTFQLKGRVMLVEEEDEDAMMMEEEMLPMYSMVGSGGGGLDVVQRGQQQHQQPLMNTSGEHYVSISPVGSDDPTARMPSPSASMLSRSLALPPLRSPSLVLPESSIMEIVQENEDVQQQQENAEKIVDMQPNQEEGQEVPLITPSPPTPNRTITNTNTNNDSNGVVTLNINKKRLSNIAILPPLTIQSKAIASINPLLTLQQQQQQQHLVISQAQFMDPETAVDSQT